MDAEREGKMKVLIADETGALAAAGVVFLSMWGYDVQTAADGLDALAKARSWKPDVLLAEVRLERMDGLALTAAVRSSAETSGVRVVLAGRADDAYARRRGETLGAVAFLPTPLAMPELQRALASLSRPAAPAPERLRAGRR